MKTSIFLLILVSLITVLYIAGSQNAVGGSQTCKSTLVIHSNPNSVGNLSYGPTSQPFLTDKNGDFKFSSLCEGWYYICVEGAGYDSIYVDGTERTYEITINNGASCP
jgi:hypothetical protein